MRLFIINLNMSVCFGHANMKKLTIYYTGEKHMGNKMGKVVYRTLSYNVVSLTNQ